MIPILETLQQSLQEYQIQNPHFYLRNAAKELGSNEEQLLILDLGKNVWRLQADFDLLLKICEKLPKITSITRNDFAVSEINGKFHLTDSSENLLKAKIGKSEIIIRRQILKNAYLVKNENRNSLQIFDAYGEAVYKIFFENYSELFQTNFDSNQVPNLLNRNSLVKRIALNANASGQISTAANSIRRLITEVAKSTSEISIKVENPAVMQIFTGNIENVKDARGWFNILDPDFNLHLKEDKLESVFMMKKETEIGLRNVIAITENTPVIQLQVAATNPVWNNILNFKENLYETVS